MMRNDLETARAEAGKMRDEIMAHAARCDGLTDQLTQVKKQLAETNSRQAASIAMPTAPPPLGTIHLYNTSLLPVRIVVNGRSYPLEPGETQTLMGFPVGPVNYEILGLGTEYRKTKVR